MTTQAGDSEVWLFLRDHAGLHHDDLANTKAGKVVVRLLKTNENREVAALGVVRLKVPKEFFLKQYRDIATFKEGPGVLEIGKFSDPPRVEDLQRLTLPPKDVEALKKCEVGDCKVKLSGEMIKRIRHEIGGPSFGDSERANQVMQEMLTGYAKAYLPGGNSVMIVYDDKKPEVHLAEEFLGLLEGSSPFLEDAPEFRNYLAEYPDVQLPTVEHFIYWSKEDMGLRPVLSLTHVIAYEKISDGRSWYFVASKQIYASHYFEGSLGLTILTDATEESPGPSCWLIYMNRSRGDGLRGWFGSVKRFIVSNRLKSGMQRYFRITKAKLEASYHAQESSGVEPP